MKKMFLLLSAAVFAGAALTGCSGIKEMNAALGEAANADEVTGMGLKIQANKTTKTDVFNAIGAPGLVLKNNLGGESWVYPRVAVRQSDVGFNASGNFAAVFPFGNTFHKGGGIAGVGASSKIDARRASYKSAGLVVSFNAEGLATGYKFTATSF